MRCIMRRSFTVLSTARTAGIRPTRRSRELNHNLVVATSAKEVFEELAVCAAQKQRPTLVNLSTALTTLARFDKVNRPPQSIATAAVSKLLAIHVLVTD